VTEVSVLSTHENAGSGGTDIPDVVEVRLPASSVYLSVLRTATAGSAARLNFTLDEIEDLRIAVDEACAMLLPQATPGEKFTCTFTLEDNALDVHVRVPPAAARCRSATRSPGRSSRRWPETSTRASTPTRRCGSACTSVAPCSVRGDARCPASPDAGQLTRRTSSCRPSRRVAGAACLVGAGRGPCVDEVAVDEVAVDVVDVTEVVEVAVDVVDVTEVVEVVRGPQVQRRGRGP
jgi:hypothetical protein